MVSIWSFARSLLQSNWDKLSKESRRRQDDLSEKQAEYKKTLIETVNWMLNLQNFKTKMQNTSKIPNFQNALKYQNTSKHFTFVQIFPLKNGPEMKSQLQFLYLDFCYLDATLSHSQSSSPTARPTKSELRQRPIVRS